MKKRLLALCLAVALMVCMLPVTALAAYQTATVKGGWLKLRSAASFDAPVLTSYYTGTQVTVINKTGDWYYVSTKDGRYGFMYGSYLTIGTATETEPTAGSAYVTSANGKGVRLRSGPSKNYGVLGLYNVGTKVTVLSYGDTWCYIRVGKQTGYMMTEFISGAKPSTPSPIVPEEPVSGISAYVRSDNGKSVNLRAGRGYEYEVIASYNINTPVTITSLGADWSRVNIGGTTGYMKTEFLGGFTATVRSSNGGNVYLRAQESKNSQALGSFPVGSQVTVLRYGGQWSYVRVHNTNQLGYMMTTYLRIN